MLKENRRLLKDGAINVTGYVVSLVLAFVMTPILVEGLGKQPYGVWTLVESVVMYLALVDAGVGAALVRFVAKYNGANDSEGISEVFNTNVAIFTVAGLMAAICTTFLCIYAPIIFQLPADLQTDARWLLAAGGFTFSLGLPLAAYSSTLTGLRKYARINLIQNSLLAIRYALLCVVIACDGGLRGVAIALVVTSIVGHAWRALTVHRLLPSLRLSLGCVTFASVHKIFGYSAYVFMASAANKLQANALIIGMFLTPEYITFYAVGSLLLKRGSTLICAGLVVLTPAFSTLEGRADHEGIRRLYVSGMKYGLLAVIPFQLGLLFFGRPFLALWIGPEIANESYVVLWILTLALPLTACHWVSNRMLQGVGKVKVYAFYSIVQAVVNVLLSLVLVNWLGLAGVALSSAVCLSAYALVVTITAFRVVRLSFASCWLDILLRPVLLACALALVWGASILSYPISSWLSLIAHASLGITLYAFAALSLEPQLVERWRVWLSQRDWYTPRSHLLSSREAEK
jgi:O-antigen/teichoic acid export membrane protein